MTNAQTEARAIAQERIWVTGSFHMGGYASGSWNVQKLSNRRTDLGEVEYVRADIHATALAAKDAELAVLKAQLVAAWNAFGPSSSRGDEPPFDTDDLEHLPLSAGGGLDEQIRELEDIAERAKAGELAAHDAANTAIRQRDEARAQLAEVIKALEFYANPIRYNGPNQRNSGNDPYSTGPYILSVERDNGEIARRAREQGGE